MDGNLQPPDAVESGTDSLEIERKYLLTGRPVLPARAVAWRFEQAYLPINADLDEPADPRWEPAYAGGRIRRATGPGGDTTCTHTIKTGQGLVRREIERRISNDQFEAAWAHPQAARLHKTRSKVTEGALIWEIDVFEELEVVLAEVELPDPETPVTLPDWLKPRIDRDVTDDPTYTNQALARRILEGG